MASDGRKCAVALTNDDVLIYSTHPTAGKCAVALTNDDVLIYSTPSAVVPLLRHPMQKKIVKLTWKPDVKESNIIVVAVPERRLLDSAALPSQSVLSDP